MKLVRWDGGTGETHGLQPVGFGNVGEVWESLVSSLLIVLL